MSAKNKSEVEILGFKNSKYVGHTAKNQKGVKMPVDFGMILDDLFLAYVGKWNQENGKQRPSGPMLVIYPKREIFYCQQFPSEDNAQGIWCSIHQNGGVRVFGNGRNNNFAILPLKSDTTIPTSVSWLCVNEEGYQLKKESVYENQESTWDAVKQIIKSDVPPNYRTLENFIKFELSSNNEIINMRVKNEKQFYGLSSKNGSGFGFIYNKRQMSIEEIGYYSEMKASNQLEFGRKISKKNLGFDLIEEGIFASEDLEETIFQYKSSEKRPQEAYKTAQKYFRQTPEYSNEFIQFSEADDIYIEVNTIVGEYINISHIQNGQKILEEGPEREKERKKNQQHVEGKKQKEERERKEKMEEEKRILSNLNREYDLNEAKKIIENEVMKKRGKITTTEMDKKYSQKKHNEGGRSRERQRQRSRERSPQRQRSRSRDRSYERSRGYSPIAYDTKRNMNQGSSSKKYQYYDYQDERKSMEIRVSPNKNKSKGSQRNPYVNDERKVREFTIDEASSTYRMNKTNQRSRDANYQGVELDQERQLMESERLLNFLKSREREEKEIMTRRQQTGRQTLMPTFGSHNYTEFSSGRKHYPKNYTYTENMENTRGAKNSPYKDLEKKSTRSPYKPHTTVRRPYSYIE